MRMSEKELKVTILKKKNGTPTVIELGGNKYALIHPNQFRNKK